MNKRKSSDGLEGARATAPSPSSPHDCHAEAMDAIFAGNERFEGRLEPLAVSVARAMRKLVEAEREACAKVCYDEAREHGDGGVGEAVADGLAELIRARGTS